MKDEGINLSLTFTESVALLHALHQAMMRAGEIVENMHREGFLLPMEEYKQQQIRTLRERHALAVKLGTELKKIPFTNNEVIDSLVTCDGIIDKMIQSAQALPVRQ